MLQMMLSSLSSPLSGEKLTVHKQVDGFRQTGLVAIGILVYGPKDSFDRRGNIDLTALHGHIVSVDHHGIDTPISPHSAEFSVASQAIVPLAGHL